MVGARGVESTRQLLERVRYMERELPSGAAPEVEQVREAYEKAFWFVNEGLSADEEGRKDDARGHYRQGLGHLLRGLSIPIAPGPEQDLARQMQQKMREMLQNVRGRLEILDKGLAASLRQELHDVPRLYPQFPPKEAPPPPFADAPEASAAEEAGAVAGASPPSASRPAEAPPAYTPQAAEGHQTVSYGTDSGEFSSLGENFYGNHSQPPPLESLGLDADELILIPSGVQIFFVNPAGEVSAPSYPGYLRIVRFLDSSLDTVLRRPPGFLQANWNRAESGEDEFQIPGRARPSSGSGARPLGPGARDVRPKGKRGKQAKDGASEEINLGHMVPCEPASAEKSKEVPEWSEKVAQNILSGASWVSWGLVKGAEFTGRAIQKGASKLRERIQPEEKPVEVSPAVTKGLHIAKQASGGAAKVSQFLVDGVCSVANCVGKELAPHVKKHGSKLVPESLRRDSDGKSPLDGALVVAASSVQGFSTVWQGLECAAKCIVSNVSAETVQTVRYKYGHPAGEATHDAVDSAVNVGVTAFNINNMGIKAMVKKTAKQTGHTILDEYKIADNAQGKALEGAGASVNGAGQGEEPLEGTSEEKELEPKKEKEKKKKEK
ncbi:spartin [Echinops telfairi]|uniref:Spartin n=1 Tax=Echinops telfairi TaxID=9371 RepID=A0ABM0J5T4_ECHTE|nr:spartin [Echinops telfairi]